MLSEIKAFRFNKNKFTYIKSRKEPRDMKKKLLNLSLPFYLEC